ncbi:MAG: prephenate dehydrogenase/arogenate dehydrogenase family protein [Paludibacteraceae bacterium]|nr:prephenate dehydrogenase [Candidatus Physcocola equi]MCQ2235102.1 prephenate dehydrogenase/arogenate dehydrogenase family protein [Paludibacteraceae bacterium]
MRILILGAGKMGTFFSDVLCDKHDVAMFDVNAKKLKFVFNTQRFTSVDEIEGFKPELVINCSTIKYTLDAFRMVMPYLPKDCILSDISSVKTGFLDFYKESGFRFVSTHPMFGPTFASLSDLSTQNAILIAESDHLGKVFFKDLYDSLHLNIFEYSFAEHDVTMAYCLSVPFASTLAFCSVMKHQDAPGTTFKRHMSIAHGLLSEDDFLISEILFNPNSVEQLRLIQARLTELENIVSSKDSEAMKQFLTRARENVK